VKSLKTRKNCFFERLSLTIHPSKYYNNVKFYCSSQHPTGEVVKEFLLNVTYPAEKVYFEVVSEDANLKTLKCIADANPIPIYRWTNDKDDVVVNDQIIELDVNKDTTYTCTATNYIDGLIYGSTFRNITQSQLKSLEEQSTSASSSNIAIIIGAVVGVVLLLVCIMLLVYFFLLKPNRNFKEEKYLTPKNTNDNNSSRPMIQHPSLRPPSPTTNPPNDDDNISYHSDDVKSPFTTLVKAPSNIEIEENPEVEITTGLTSRASLNFQARRKRPSSTTTSVNRRSHIDHNKKHQPFSYSIPLNTSTANRSSPNYIKVQHHGSSGNFIRTEQPVEYAQIRSSNHRVDSHLV